MTVPARILVADDSAAMRALLKGVLCSAGYTVVMARDGHELVSIAQNNPPDLLLIDLMMPVMDGYEALRQLRNDTRTAHLPMVIVTARSESADIIKGFDSDADDYITKPFDAAVLLARIRRHLRRQRQRPVYNPLTGLPGNVLLQNEVQRRLDQQQDFMLIYADLDNFKALNDAYGFARGDRAIQLLAHVLQNVEKGGDLLTHIGGDDFAMLYSGNEIETLCKEVITNFDARVGSLYNEADRQRGYLLSRDRDGRLRHFDLLSVSVAVVDTRKRMFETVDQISKAAADIKRQSKNIRGSSYVIDRVSSPLVFPTTKNS